MFIFLKYEVGPLKNFLYPTIFGHCAAFSKGFHWNKNPKYFWSLPEIRSLHWSLNEVQLKGKTLPDKNNSLVFRLNIVAIQPRHLIRCHNDQILVEF